MMPLIGLVIASLNLTEEWGKQNKQEAHRYNQGYIQSSYSMNTYKHLLLQLKERLSCNLKHLLTNTQILVRKNQRGRESSRKGEKTYC